MMKSTRGRTAAAAVVAAVGVITACSTGLSEASATPTSTAPAMPASATFIADVPDQAGETMTMAITAENEKIVAYATNGIDDDAYFFGTQRDGQMRLMSMYGDELTASFDGKEIDGEVTMNEPDAKPLKFAALRVEAPAGMYTANVGTARATYVVRSNGTAAGVMDNSAPGDHKVTDEIMRNEQVFKDSVREMRLGRQMQQAPQLNTNTMKTDMGGQQVTAVRVTGDMSF